MYRDFLLYCTSRGSKEKAEESTPRVVTKKLLASPEFQAGTKFGPLSPIQKISPILKSVNPEARSVLRQISGYKKPAIPAASPQSAESGKVSKDTGYEFVTVTIFGAKKQEEDKTTTKNNSKFMPFINKAKRTPYIDASKLSEITLSPLSNTEGMHRVPEFSIKTNLTNIKNGVSVEELKVMPKQDPQSFSHKVMQTERVAEESKERDIILCACGNECEDDKETECSTCSTKFKDNTYSSYLYEKSDKQVLARYWFVIIGNQFYRTYLLETSIRLREETGRKL